MQIFIKHFKRKTGYQASFETAWFVSSVIYDYPLTVAKYCIDISLKRNALS